MHDQVGLLGTPGVGLIGLIIIGGLAGYPSFATAAFFGPSRMSFSSAYRYVLAARTTKPT